MAAFSVPRYSFSVLLLFVFCLVTHLAAKPISSFSLKRFAKDVNFDPEITLYGDAQVVNAGTAVNVTQSELGSVGRVVYKHPFKFVEGKGRKPLSFSTFFEFSISSGDGDGLAFVFLPSGFPVEMLDGHSSFGLGLEKKRDGVLVVGFGTYLDSKVSDSNANRVGIDVGGVVSKASNVSSTNLVLNSGKKLRCWIDYDASSKRLEVRLSESGDRPYDPLLSYPINLAEMWKEEEIFVGLSSSNGNSTKTTSIFSWSFRLRHVPTWMHSEPLNPKYTHHSQPVVLVQERSTCLSRILTSLMVGIACGALTTFIVLFMRAIFANRHAVVVVPAEYPVHPMEYGYEKIKIVVEKGSNDVKKVET
ncbi:hypothetical protein IFM89_013314 [Coptis chinensis]|uniref:Legume lectin domain-containing protein n=1 Tax=Coptis chinensis TaxID=261450 RepID=A0A835LLC9_9MAGN|nr:hypothetical protein IFM89_013314 [Coptis chinensis]